MEIKNRKKRRPERRREFYWISGFSLYSLVPCLGSGKRVRMCCVPGTALGAGDAEMKQNPWLSRPDGGGGLRHPVPRTSRAVQCLGGLVCAMALLLAYGLCGIGQVA